MLKLNTIPAQEQVIEIAAGVSLTCRPATTSVMLEIMVARPELEAETGAELDRLGFAKLAARIAVTGWSGFVGDDGKPIKLSPAALDTAMDLYPVYAAFESSYLVPAMVLVEEGNGSAASRSGTSGAARNTAKTAKRPAKTARKPKASRKA